MDDGYARYILLSPRIYLPSFTDAGPPGSQGQETEHSKMAQDPSATAVCCTSMRIGGAGIHSQCCRRANNLGEGGIMYPMLSVKGC